MTSPPAADSANTSLLKKSLSYQDAGVNIDAGNRLVECIKPIAQRTHRSGVLGGLGGFGALFELPWHRYQQPILVSGTDGVGTKLKLAIMANRHDTIGIDLVAMCVNDVIVQGAEPLFFLDYYATGALNVEAATQIISGIGRGCELAGAALVGGETAEMPGLYAHDDYDLAGFCVGIVEKAQLIDGYTVQADDILLGLASSGAHSNGYSLIRKILAQTPHALEQTLEGRPLLDILLEPTRIYVKSILALMQQVPIHALAHITGGGLAENLVRVIPNGYRAEIELARWPRPALFNWLQQHGQVAEAEMLRTFNCGIGMIVCVAAAHANQATLILQQYGEQVYTIGKIQPQAGHAAQVIVR